MGQHLLLVDSDRSFVKEHQVSLEAAFELELAGSTEGVLPRLETGAFAAVFICVEVGDNKGYALCSSIRKNPKLDGVKIALISAKATEEEYRRHQGLKGRADLYLHKPISPSTLVAALSPLVPGRALDPDNPLGELADFELGEDWLDGLKGTLDGPSEAPFAAPPFEAPAAAPSPAFHPEAWTMDPPDDTHVLALEEQIASLLADLQERDQGLAATRQRLQSAETELEQIRRETSSVTLNLDELERSHRESEALTARLADLERFRAQAEALQAALAARDEELAHQRQELDVARAAKAQLGATLEGLTRQLADQEAQHQAGLAVQQEQGHTHLLRIAELEAAMETHGQALADQLRQREEELEKGRTDLLERDQQLLTLQEQIQSLQEEGSRFSCQLDLLQQELGEATLRQDAEKREWMHGLEQKEAEVLRQGQLLRDLGDLLQTIQDQARQGSDLARG
jgi:DNA-binding response OmpR family regulator